MDSLPPDPPGAKSPSSAPSGRLAHHQPPTGVPNPLSPNVATRNAPRPPPFHYPPLKPPPHHLPGAQPRSEIGPKSSPDSPHALPTVNAATRTEQKKPASPVETPLPAPLPAHRPQCRASHSPPVPPQFPASPQFAQRVSIQPMPQSLAVQTLKPRLPLRLIANYHRLGFFSKGINQRP